MTLVRLQTYARAYLTLHASQFFRIFCGLQIFFQTIFFKNHFGNTIRVPRSLDPDQAERYVGPTFAFADDKRGHQQAKG